MNYKSFEKLIKDYLNDKNNKLTPLFIEGESGIGKTEIIKQISAVCGFNTFIIQIGTKTLEYFMGLPETDKDSNDEHITKWSAPELVSLVNNSDKPAVVFIDDFHLSRDEERKIMFELLTDKTMHGFKLKKDTKIILAANPYSAEYGSTTTELPKPIRSRVMKFELNADFEQWKEVSIKKGINSLIISFLTFKNDFFIGEYGKNGQYPCPRSWWSLSGYINAGFEMTSELVCAAVGNTASAEFMAYYDIFLKYERKKPKNWKSLSTYKDKAAFISYLINKAAPDIIKKYCIDISQDVSIRPLMIILWKFMSQSKDPKMLELFRENFPEEIIQEYAISSN